MTPEIPDEQWFRSLAEGNEAVLHFYFTNYFPALVGYVGDIVNHPAEAEDIASSVFMSCWDHREKLTTQAYLINFLYVTAKNKAISHLRKQKTLSSRQWQWIALYEKEENTDFLDSVDKEALKSMILQEIYHRAGRLPPACKEIFESRYVRGEEVNEIADRLGIDPQTVRNQLSHAVKVLRAALQEKNLLSLLFILFFTK